jgi:drug/metabolite transporter (DMT)-like permease
MKKFLNIPRNTKGLFLMLLGQLSFAINDTIVKFMVKISENNFSTLDIIFIRGFFASILILLIIIFFTKNNLKTVFKNKKSYLRGFFEVLTAAFFFAGLIMMPMANVYTLLMTAPFIVTLYSYFILKEKVGIRRWAAVIIGFIGVIIVINPKNLEFGLLFIFPIISAFFLTLRDVITKEIVNKNNSLDITLVTSLLVMIFSGIGSFLLNSEIHLYNITYIFISSLFLTSGYVCSILTVFYAPLSLTASIRYSAIVFGIILGYIILGEEPSFNMIIGAMIITSSGLFVIKREKDLGKIN